MQCDEIMTRKVISVGTTDTVKTAAQLMRDADIGFLPVCDPVTGAVLGAITDRDLTIRLVAEDRLSNTLVGEVMTPEVVWCAPTDDVITAERLMGKHQKSRILCLDAARKPVGVISLSDLAQSEEEPRVAETVRQVTAREAQVP